MNGFPLWAVPLCTAVACTLLVGAALLVEEFIGRRRKDALEASFNRHPAGTRRDFGLGDPLDGDDLGDTV